MQTTTTPRRPATRLGISAPFLALLMAPWCLAGLDGAVPASTAPTAPPHSDAQFAHELLRLGQNEIIKAQMAASAGTPEENLWKAQEFIADWDESRKGKAGAPADTAAYFTALEGYLKAQGDAPIDGAWALDHARFILARLCEPIINRMEYWANDAADRAALAPMTQCAQRLLRQGGVSLQASLRTLENRKPFDEAAYLRAYSAAGEVEYYAAWAQYFRAMTLDPADPRRKELLAATAVALAKWAVEEPDNGVNYQAFLLRGKVNSESGDLPRALSDLQVAQNEKAPAWVQYQARYQIVVADLNAGDLKAAQSMLSAFRRWIPRDNLEAQLSADMLAYRVAWAIAGKIDNGAERRAARVDALAILANVIQRDPRFRDLVYQQLASQTPPDADPEALPPMQQLALAYAAGLEQRPETPAGAARLARGVVAAQAARNNPTSTKADKLEATFLLGLCDALQGKLAEAARCNVEFAEQAPGDPRARAVVELALQQIGELRRAAGDQGLPADTLAVAQRALALSTSTFGDTRWRYTQAHTLEDAGQIDQAVQIYGQIPPDDKNYLDARYRLVNIALTRFNQLGPRAPEVQTRQAAAVLFAACSKFVELLDHPPAGAAVEALQRAKAYRADIWMIETAVALNPAVKDTAVAQDRLDRLDEIKAQLTDAQKAAVFRYRVLTYQLAGQPDKAFAVVREYTKTQGGGAMDAIRGLALSTIEEIHRIEPTDRATAQRLAGNVVQLLDPMIRQAEQEDKKDSAFEYRLIQGDMLIRAGKAQDAEALANRLVSERDTDLRASMMQARALFAEAQGGDAKRYAAAQDRFTALLARITPGAEGFWECWLRIIQSMEAQGAADAPAEIKKRLGDLKGVYGSKFGGEAFKSDFALLAVKYGV